MARRTRHSPLFLLQGQCSIVVVILAECTLFNGVRLKGIVLGRLAKQERTLFSDLLLSTIICAALIWSQIYFFFQKLLGHDLKIILINSS